MSAVNPPSKIVLGSNTNVSLHDRFTKLAKVKPIDNKPVKIHAASAKNRNLALKMAERPSVKAALNPKTRVKASLNQRLGVGNRVNSSRINSAKKPAHMRLGPSPRKVPVQSRLSNLKQAPAKSKVARVGPKGGMGLKNRVKFLKQNSLKQKLQKPGVKTAIAKGGMKKPVSAKPGAVKKPAEPKNKESLDMELDQYMSKTKGFLDNDLDSYMAQAH